MEKLQLLKKTPDNLFLTVNKDKLERIVSETPYVGDRYFKRSSFLYWFNDIKVNIGVSEVISRSRYNSIAWAGLVMRCILPGFEKTDNGYKKSVTISEEDIIITVFSEQFEDDFIWAGVIRNGA